MPALTPEDIKRMQMLQKDPIALRAYRKERGLSDDVDIGNMAEAQGFIDTAKEAAGTLGDKIKGFFTSPPQEKDPAQEFNKFLGRQPAAPQPESLPEASSRLTPEEELRAKARIDALKAQFEKLNKR